MFDFFRKKKKYPLLTREMIEPANTPLSTTDAKKAYKSFMLQVGYFDKDDKLGISDDVRYFAEEIKMHEGGLKEECAECKWYLSDYKKDLKGLEQKFKKTNDEGELNDLKSDIEEIQDEISTYTKDLEKLTAELEVFKKDKTDFLITYVNNELQGSKE